MGTHPSIVQTHFVRRVQRLNLLFIAVPFFLWISVGFSKHSILSVFLADYFYGRVGSYLVRMIALPGGPLPAPLKPKFSIR